MRPEQEPYTLPSAEPNSYYLEDRSRYDLKTNGWRHLNYEANRYNPSEIRLVSLDRKKQARLVGKRVDTLNPDGSIYCYKLESGISDEGKKVQGERM